jgi:integrase
MARKRRSYQLGSISPHNDQYTVRYWLLDYNTGKMIRKREIIPGAATKKEARELSRPIMERVNNHNNNPLAESFKRKQHQSLTFTDFINSRWQRYMANEKIADSTRYSYDSMTRNHLLPFFGERPLKDITPSDVTDFFSKLAEDEVSPKFALNIYALVNLMFDLAFQYDLIPVNPVRSKLHKPRAERQEKPALDVAKVVTVLNHIDEDYRLLFILLASTGMRSGECLGLMWRDIDFSARLLFVKQSLWRGKLKKPKTKSSVRKFRLHHFLLKQLQEHQAKSKYPKADDFVFCREDGRPFEPDHLRECVLYPAMDKVEIERTSRAYGLHIFRHTAGSIGYDKTGKMKLVQKFLGHAQESTTSNIYVHTKEDEVAETAELVAEEIFSQMQAVQDFSSGMVN